MTTEIKGSHLIGGRWIASRGDAFSAINPADGTVLAPEFHDASQAEIDQAADAAAKAFEQTLELAPGWSAEFLDAIAEQIMNLGDLLLERTEAETALPRARLTGERARTVGQLKMFAAIVREGSWVDAVIDSADESRAPARRPDLRRMLRPRGPVAVFGASNFPFAFGAVGGDTASALAAGCPVIVKGHPSHPGTSELFAHAVLAAIEQLNLPAGMFSLIQGRNKALSAALVKHSAIAAVGFTGSLKAGRALFDLAAARATPIPVYAEMGSLNPIFILPSAITERAQSIGKDLAGSVLLGGGQFCTKPGLVFTIGDADALTDALSATLQSAAAPTMLNQPLRDAFAKETGEFKNIGGVKTAVQGKPSAFASMSPCLFVTDAQIWMREHKLHEEAFGPGTLIIRCRDQAEAIACIEHLEGSLTGTIQIGPSDQPMAAAILRKLEGKVGRAIINGYPTGVEVNHAIVHGGPYPATTDPGFTSVGSAAIRRFVRMIAYQDVPDEMLPAALRSENPLNIRRIMDGRAG